MPSKASSGSLAIAAGAGKLAAIETVVQPPGRWRKIPLYCRLFDPGAADTAGSREGEAPAEPVRCTRLGGSLALPYFARSAAGGTKPLAAAFLSGPNRISRAA